MPNWKKLEKRLYLILMISKYEVKIEPEETKKEFAESEESEIIKENEDAEFSLKALNKIDDEDILLKVYEANISEELSVRAVSKVKTQKPLIELIKNEPSWRIREAAVKNISNKKVLKEVAASDENEYVRSVAKNRI